MKVIIFVEKDDLNLKWEDCSENEKKDIALVLNNQGLGALGYFQKKCKNM